MEKQKKILDELITYMVDNEGEIVEHYVVCQLVKLQRSVDKNNIITPVVESTSNSDLFDCQECGSELSNKEIMNNTCTSCGCFKAVK